MTVLVQAIGLAAAIYALAAVFVDMRHGGLTAHEERGGDEA